MEASETLEFTVKFADGTNVQYSRVEEIIEQPNSEHRSIISLIAANTVSVIDTATNTVVATVPVTSGAQWVAITPF